MSARTFRHGVHPEGHKELTSGKPIERIPVPDEVILHLSQHLGAPSRPVVAVGQKVARGQLVAEADGFVSVPLHASITGTVVAIEKRHHPSGRMTDAVVIARDPASAQTLYDEHPIPWRDLTTEQLIAEIQSGGFVGLGGAAFPTHVKLVVPEGKRVQFFLVNGAECEPYLTSDHRVMIEWADSIALGTEIVMRVLGAQKATIGVEDNKEDAMAALNAALPESLPCDVMALRTKYPQGAEKMLVKAVLDREIPSGKLPIDAQVIVSNVGTVAEIGERFAFGQPLIERVVTVTGPAVRNPSTLLVPVGTPLSRVLAHCGGLTEDARQVIFGGPLMGTPQQYLEVPILKGTSGILCLREAQVEVRREYPCIRCSSCLDACPVFLNPSALGMLARVGRHDDMLAFHILDCMECGACSYVCPSNIASACPRASCASAPRARRRSPREQL
jgi:electron transport complex protein RnfC